MEGVLVALGAFGLVFLAEFGDRTQFVLFALATRVRRLPLFLGAGSAFFLQTLLAVTIGDRLSAWLPTEWVLLAGAFLFLGLGGLSFKRALRDPDEAESEAGKPPSTGNGAFLTAFLFVLIGELGDKTQIAAAALAATSQAPVAVFIGALLGLLASAGFALVVGRWVAGRFAPRTVRWVAAGAFLFAGVLMIGVLLQRTGTFGLVGVPVGL